MQAKFQYLRYHAYEMVSLAISQMDLIVPSLCERCYQQCTRSNLHAHHHDYSKPLDVEWLCRSCHELEHGQDKYHGEGRKKSFVRKHLAQNPSDLSMTVRELAEKLHVGKSTVANVMREFK